MAAVELSSDQTSGGKTRAAELRDTNAHLAAAVGSSRQRRQAPRQAAAEGSRRGVIPHLSSVACVWRGWVVSPECMQDALERGWLSIGAELLARSLVPLTLLDLKHKAGEDGDVDCEQKSERLQRCPRSV